MVDEQLYQHSEGAWICHKHKIETEGQKHGSNCYRCLKDKTEQLQAKLDKYNEENQSFGNVLAVVHRDGGHYISKHGHKKASKDAIQIVLGLRAALDKVLKALRNLHDGQNGPPLLRHEKTWQAAYDEAGNVLEEMEQ